MQIHAWSQQTFTMIKRAYDICSGTDAEKAIAGQNKYKQYFAGKTKQKLYGKYEPEVDYLLTDAGLSCCIVACNV